jgi:hypothetical protein
MPSVDSGYAEDHVTESEGLWGQANDSQRKGKAGCGLLWVLHLRHS